MGAPWSVVLAPDLSSLFPAKDSGPNDDAAVEVEPEGACRFSVSICNPFDRVRCERRRGRSPPALVDRRGSSVARPREREDWEGERSGEGCDDDKGDRECDEEGEGERGPVSTSDCSLAWMEEVSLGAGELASSCLVPRTPRMRSRKGTIALLGEAAVAEVVAAARADEDEDDDDDRGGRVGDDVIVVGWSIVGVLSSSMRAGDSLELVAVAE